MHVERELALVLRTTRYGESDLVVDLLGQTTGRFSAMARGARKSQRRFGGALEIGTLVRVDAAGAGRGLPALTTCDVVRAPKAIRGDLDRIQHLSYVIEIARHCTREGEGDPETFRLVTAYIDALEAEPAFLERLLSWELALLAHLGYALRLDACVTTGETPDAISLSAGGAVQRRAAALGDATPVPPPALAALAAIDRGERIHLQPTWRAPLRRALDRVWAEICGRPLRTAAWLDGPAGPE